MDAVVCNYNKFGYCKFKENCRRLHNDVVCQEANCEVKSCFSRHPRSCKFYSQFNHCKFGVNCRYLHANYEMIKRIDEDIAAIKSKALDFEKIIAEKDKQIKSLDEKIMKLPQHPSRINQSTLFVLIS